MPWYKAWITEVHEGTIEVEADTEQEALDEIDEMAHSYIEWESEERDIDRIEEID